MKSTLYIQNLKCGGCANTITKKISELTNVSDVKVNVDEAAVSFNYKNDLDLHNVKETLKLIGYPIDGDANSIGTKAKSFVSCAIGRMN